MSLADLVNDVTLHAAAAALPADPTTWGDVHGAKWFSKTLPRTFALHIWADTAVAITAAKLVGAEPRPVVIADDDVEAVSAANNTLQFTAHAFKNGDGPVRMITSGALPGGVVALTDYWIGVVDANNIKLFASRAGLLKAGAVGITNATTVDHGVVDITGAGSGTNTIQDTPTTQRLHWMDLEDVNGTTLLGVAGDGALSLTTTRGALHFFIHSRLVLAYAVVATINAATSAGISLEDA